MKCENCKWKVERTMLIPNYVPFFSRSEDDPPFLEYTRPICRLNPEEVEVRYDHWCSHFKKKRKVSK